MKTFLQNVYAEGTLLYLLDSLKGDRYFKELQGFAINRDSFVLGIKELSDDSSRQIRSFLNSLFNSLCRREALC